MPQELRVLQCIHCQVFQVDIVKKANKWQCKVCNAKQNLRKVLFHGTGAECRQKVQELNQEKAERNECKSDAILDSLQNDEDDEMLFAVATQIDVNGNIARNSANDASDDDRMHYAQNEPMRAQKRKLPTNEEQAQQSKTNKWNRFL